MAPNSNALKFLLQKDRWVVSYTDNPELAKAMTNIGVNPERRVNQNQTKTYWFVPVERFETVRPLLLDHGYSEYAPQSATAAFRIDADSKPAEEKHVNPNHNPILYPDINVYDPKAAVEFAQNHTYSVSELNKCIRGGINKLLPMIWLTGEIDDSNNKDPLEQTKTHKYFNLVEKVQNNDEAKSETFSISAIIWKSNIAKILKKLQLANQGFNKGVKIRALGKLDYYEVGGKLSFIIQDIDTVFAEGEVYKQKLLIANELKRLGIYDKNRQLRFPVLPLRLAVFSSKDAAGMGDFVDQLSKSGYPFKITLFTTALQGKNVEKEFLNNYRILEQIGCEQFDLALILRGGGGNTELGTFNSLEIAKTIANSPLKFYIGIGHKKDCCILDDIAVYAITPTDAAETLINNCDELVRNLRALQDSIALCAKHHLESSATNLYRASEQFTNSVRSTCQRAESQLERQKTNIIHLAEKRIDNAQHNLTTMGQRLQNSAQQLAHHATLQIHSLESQVKGQAETLIKSKHENLKLLATRIDDISKQNLQKYRRETDSLQNLIRAYNPEKWFERGFVLMSDKEGNAITSIQSIAPKETVHIRMKDGKATAVIKTTTPDNKN